MSFIQGYKICILCYLEFIFHIFKYTQIIIFNLKNPCSIISSGSPCVQARTKAWTILRTYLSLIKKNCIERLKLDFVEKVWLSKNVAKKICVTNINVWRISVQNGVFQIFDLLHFKNQTLHYHFYCIIEYKSLISVRYFSSYAKFSIIFSFFFLL